MLQRPGRVRPQEQGCYVAVPGMLLQRIAPLHIHGMVKA
jgi:hypothetical protein